MGAKTSEGRIFIKLLLAPHPHRAFVTIPVRITYLNSVFVHCRHILDLAFNILYFQEVGSDFLDSGGGLPMKCSGGGEWGRATPLNPPLVRIASAWRGCTNYVRQCHLKNASCIKTDPSGRNSAQPRKRIKYIYA